MSYRSGRLIEEMILNELIHHMHASTCCLRVLYGNLFANELNLTDQCENEKYWNALLYLSTAVIEADSKALGVSYRTPGTMASGLALDRHEKYYGKACMHVAQTRDKV